jgi:hypothetical protein
MDDFGLKSGHFASISGLKLPAGEMMHGKRSQQDAAP